MSKLQDTEYLRGEQYHDSERLNARISLHTRFSTNPYGWFKWTFDHFEIGLHARVLELGCGPGDLWRENANRVPNTWAITLSDFSAGMIAQARENLNGLLQGVRMAVVDVQAIPFRESLFDVVIANHFLYHVPDRQRALSEIRRVLRPGGWLYASTIGVNHLLEISDLVTGFDPVIEDVFKSQDRSFTLENGEAQLRGWFSQVKVDCYPDSLLVTEVQPLVDYILSTVRFDQVKGRHPALAAFLSAHMVANGGVISIKKESGLFTAVKNF